MRIDNYKIILLSTCLLLSLICKGQEEQGFQRIYSAEETLLFQKSSVASLDGGYFIGSVSLGEDQIFKLHITKHNLKGNIDWANEYFFDAYVSPINSKSVDLQVLEDGSLFVTAIRLDPGVGGLRDEHVLLKIDSSNGDIVWSNQLFKVENIVIPFNSLPVGVPNHEGGINVYTSNTDVDSVTGAAIPTGVNIARIGPDNSLESSDLYRNIQGDTLPLFGLITDAAYDAIDSSQIYSSINNLVSIQGVGIITVSGTLNKNDKDGNPIFVNRYSYDQNNIPIAQMQITAITTASDSSYLALTFVNDLVTGLVDWVVMKTDFDGNLLWAKSLEVSIPQTGLTVNDIGFTPSNEIMITGKYFDVTNLQGGDYGIFLDLDGNEIRQVDYGSDNSVIAVNLGGQLLDISAADLNRMPDGNMLISTNGLDPIEGTISTYAIKVDSVGQAMCSDTFTLASITDYSFLVEDTLSVEVTPFAILDTVEVEREAFNDYLNPVLTLPDTNYCPQDPIMFEMDAFLPEGTSYEWNTGDTTSSIIATEEAEFTVTVTMGSRVCYTLCDTATIAQFDFPEASISVDRSNVCEDDFITLRGFLTAGAGPRDYLWNTTETTSSIDITTPGNYSVTITDNCGNRADVTVNIQPADFLSPSNARIVPDQSRLCEEDVIVLTALLDTTATSFIWSTNETTESIEITGPGVYSVVITSICGDEFETSIEIPEGTFMREVDVAISTQETGICDEKMVILTASTSSQIITYDWSTGNDVVEIAVIEPGPYAVTVTDICGDTGEAMITVDTDFSLPTIEIASINVDNSDCENGFLLQVFPVSSENIGFTDFDWSNGATGDTIRVFEAGDFSVTVTDLCGTTASASVTVNLDDQLLWPNIFFPRSNEQVNQTFGPYVSCPDLFQATDYSLEIFNRWGNKVFSGESISDRWNGRKDNSGSDLNPRDTYMYVYSYIDGAGMEQKGGGHVILSR